MSLQVSIVVTGDKRVQQKMKRLGSSLYNFNDAMKDIGHQGSLYFQGPAWLSQGGVFGNKWARLSTRYAARKAKTYPGRGPLEKTGTMRHSFDFDANRTSVTIGNRDPKFKYHQSTEPRTKIPRREMIGISTGFKKIVQQIIQEDIKKKIRQA